ncbi:hypothetical protein BC826DRAFT_1175812 [Russula brevipes]|nr:hypothetical protein BC826DRAFT_1175812 [Russula brevipes]
MEREDEFDLHAVVEHTEERHVTVLDLYSQPLSGQLYPSNYSDSPNHQFVVVSSLNYSTLAHNAYDWGRQIPMHYGIYAIPVLSHFVTCWRTGDHRISKLELLTKLDEISTASFLLLSLDGIKASVNVQKSFRVFGTFAMVCSGQQFNQTLQDSTRLTTRN